MAPKLDVNASSFEPLYHTSFPPLPPPTSKSKKSNRKTAVSVSSPPACATPQPSKTHLRPAAHAFKPRKRSTPPPPSFTPRTAPDTPPAHRTLNATTSSFEPQQHFLSKIPSGNRPKYYPPKQGNDQPPWQHHPHEPAEKRQRQPDLEWAEFGRTEVWGDRTGAIYRDTSSKGSAKVPDVPWPKQSKKGEFAKPPSGWMPW